MVAGGAFTCKYVRLPLHQQLCPGGRVGMSPKDLETTIDSAAAYSAQLCCDSAMQNLKSKPGIVIFDEVRV
jgi:hypothetical protein